MKARHRMAVTTATVQKRLIGGLPVQFKPQEGQVIIAGDALSYEEWKALMETINRMFERTGQHPTPSPPIQPFQVAPWWLRLLGVGGTIPRAQVPRGYTR